MKYFAKIKYLGTDFCGFQVQPHKRTVQGVLCESLSQLFGAPCNVTGCSRTDSGVHANEFCITVECDTATVPPDKLPIAAAEYMPPDLSLFYAESCSDDFHPRYDAKSKEYLYIIKNEKIYDPFFYGRAWFLSRTISNLQIERMKSASKYILGNHDFSSFMSVGSDVKDTVRTVFALDISSVGNDIVIKISADGFLYNMVRIIVGTLVDVAYGRFEPNQIEAIIESRDRKNAGMTAPACGLYLNKVVY